MSSSHSFRLFSGAALFLSLVEGGGGGWSAQAEEQLFPDSQHRDGRTWASHRRKELYPAGQAAVWCLQVPPWASDSLAVRRRLGPGNYASGSKFCYSGMRTKPSTGEGVGGREERATRKEKGAQGGGRGNLGHWESLAGCDIVQERFVHLLSFCVFQCLHSSRYKDWSQVRPLHLTLAGPESNRRGCRRHLSLQPSAQPPFLTFIHLLNSTPAPTPFLVVLCDIWDLNFPPGDWICVLCIGSVQS